MRRSRTSWSSALRLEAGGGGGDEQAAGTDGQFRGVGGDCYVGRAVSQDRHERSAAGCTAGDVVYAG